MRVLIAPDSFGGTLSAAEAAEAIAAGWERAAPNDILVRRPLSDGGPGFLDVLAPVLGGKDLPVTAMDPLGRETPARVLLASTGGVLTAYVESAQACGLHLLGAADRDPKVTTSYGLGMLLAAAVEAGARRVVVGLGGSATNDGGAGMLAALGAVALDAGGTAVPYGGAALAGASSIAGAPRLRHADLVGATDVDNPLLGRHGASAVFGPQKGASDADVALLDAALANWAALLERDLDGCPRGLADLPGAGAAGGLGAALLALGGRCESGITMVRELSEFDRAVEDADLVVTGEGSYDFQSLRGKVVSGVATAALQAGVPCVVLAGQVAVGRRQMAAAGVEAAYSLAERAGSVEAAMVDSAAKLADLAADIAREWSRAGR